MKSEFQHKLDLVKIHKGIIDILEKNIAEMGSYCPPHQIMDLNNRLEIVRNLFLNCIQLVQSGEDTAVIDLMHKLKEITDGSIDGNTLHLGIIILEKILNSPVKKEDVDFFKRETGININMINCQNVVIGSTLEAASSISIGDEPKNEITELK